MNQTLRLSSSVRYLKGVGPERARLLEELGILTISDLLFFFPRRYENREPIKRVSQLVGGDEKECVAGKILSASTIRTKSGTQLFRVFLAEGRKKLFVTWFNASYLSKSIRVGQRVIFWGKAEKKSDVFHMSHPEFEVADAGHSYHFGGIVPIYPLVEDLSQKHLRALSKTALEEWGSRLGERLPEDRRIVLGLDRLATALIAIHFPDSFEALEKSRRRLVFDEFYCLQLAVGLRRIASQVERPELSHGREDRVRLFLESLPFQLTPGQKKALNEIVGDMKRVRPMNRLLQADVGSGKTVVASAAILYAVSNGFQAALMAPTEVLARQHMFSLSRDLEPMGVRLAYVGRGAQDSARILEKIAGGEVDGVIGTHALLEEGVRFKNLGLAVIDEQHKFGVAQRSALQKSSGKPVHFLMLTATPIPRSLAMTLYGDLDISEIREMPKGRLPVRTARMDLQRRAELYRYVVGEVSRAGRAFVVCPLLSKALKDTRNALDVAKELGAEFPELGIGCLHGRLQSEQKDKLIREFRDGKIKILVSTVVIEVGIDVPDAQFILIENAERFGLAQLHQLRGRVGRGGGQSYCFLISDSQEPQALERLDAFCAMTSGFDIAQKDLESRGAGETMGRRQHGLPELVIGDFVRDEALLVTARNEAARTLNLDPELSQEKHRFLRKMVEVRYGAMLSRMTAQ